MNFNLVLSGGGVRGYAHIGVLRALFEKEISINAVSGASAGALIGAFICDGFHPVEIEELILVHEPKISFNYFGIKESILSFNSVAELLRKNLRSQTFDKLKTPLFVSVTNLKNGKHEIFNSGNLINALLASSAVPVLFPPVIINEIPYADGGLTSNLPVQPFFTSKEKIIGVHVNPVQDFSLDIGMVQNIDRTLHLLLRSNVIDCISKCDIFIEPPDLKQFHLFESKKTSKIIKTGYDFVKQSNLEQALNQV
jgi:NTE family protein